jgi:hypothetical protein
VYEANALAGLKIKSLRPGQFDLKGIIREPAAFKQLRNMDAVTGLLWGRPICFFHQISETP